MTNKLYCDLCGEHKAAIRSIQGLTEIQVFHMCNSCVSLLGNYKDRGHFELSRNKADFGVKSE